MLWLFIMLGTHRKLILEDENVYAGAGRRRRARGSQSASSAKRIARSRTCWRTAQSREIIKHINDHKGGLKELNAFYAGDCRSFAPAEQQQKPKLQLRKIRVGWLRVDPVHVLNYV